MPAKKGPIITGRKLPGGRGEGRGRKQPLPIKPGPKDGKNPKLPYRRPDGKPIPKKGNPGKGPKKNPAKQAGGNIRDLLYRAKPGEMQKMPFKGSITADLRKKLEKLEGSKERLRKVPSPRPIKDTIQSVFNGTARKRDNSAVTYNTRVKPKFPSMMEGPYRIKKATVKTGRGR
jgi:hypothetical protein